MVTHWFNPPHIVPVVEVVKNENTSDETADLAYALLEKIKKLPVKINREISGFIVNRIQIAMVREVLDLLEQGVASASDIDRAVRGSIGFRLASIGPLLTMDLGGLQVWYNVFQNLLPLIRSSTKIPDVLERLVARRKQRDSEWKGVLRLCRGFFPGKLDKAIHQRDQEFLDRLKHLYWRKPMEIKQSRREPCYGNLPKH